MVKLIEFILHLFGVNINNENEQSTLKEPSSERQETIYQIKPLMSFYERKFYYILKQLEPQYQVMPQLNLASIIKKVTNNKYYSELFRNIDFAIFTKNFNNLLLLIEINDKSHNQYNRKDRDLKVKKICNDINIKILYFYTNYPNEPDYVINRIRQELKSIEKIEDVIEEI